MHKQTQKESERTFNYMCRRCLLNIFNKYYQNELMTISHFSLINPVLIRFIFLSARIHEWTLEIFFTQT